jgi:hypothetical protein
VPSKFGIAKQFVYDNFCDGPGDVAALKNGHVLKIYYDCDKKLMSTVRQIEAFFMEEFSQNQVMAAVSSVIKKSIDYFKHLSEEKEMTKFRAVCDEPFRVLPKPKNPSTSRSSTPAPPMVSPPSTPSTSAVAPASSGCMTRSSSKATPQKQRLKMMLASSRLSTDKKKDRIRQLKKRLKAPKKVVNQTIRRKNLTIAKLNQQLKELALQSSQTAMGQQVAELQEEVNRLKAAAMRRRQRNRNKALICGHLPLLKSKDEEITQLQHDKLLLQEELEAERQQQLTAQSKTISLMQDGKSYSANTRMLVFDYVTHNVPMEAIPPLVEQSMVRHGHTADKGKVPQRSAACNSALAPRTMFSTADLCGTLHLSAVWP